MMDDYKFAAILWSLMDINPIEALYLTTTFMRKDLSWAYAPTSVRYSLQRLIQMHVLCLVDRQIDDDPQVYRFIEMSEFGRELIRKALEK